jgi:hypothetical protein
MIAVGRADTDQTEGSLAAPLAIPTIVMAGLVPAIHDLLSFGSEHLKVRDGAHCNVRCREALPVRWSCQGLTLASKGSLSTEMPMEMLRVHLIRESSFHRRGAKPCPGIARDFGWLWVPRSSLGMTSPEVGIAVGNVRSPQCTSFGTMEPQVQVQVQPPKEPGITPASRRRNPHRDRR